MAKAMLALPEVFGDGDFDLWLRKFKVCGVANGWKDDDKLMRLPMLLTGKAIVVFERLPAAKKEDFKVPIKTLNNSFGGSDTGKYVAMTEFCNRKRKPSEDLDVYAFALESVLRHAMPEVGEGDRNALLRQQFIKGVEENLRIQLLQRPTLSYEETITVAKQLDMASALCQSLSSTSAGINVAINKPSNNRQEALISKLVERIESLTVRVDELSIQSLAINAINSRQSSRQPAQGACFSCSQFNHRAAECPTRQTQDTCYVCGRRGHFTRDCYDRFRNQSRPAGNGQRLTR